MATASLALLIAVIALVAVIGLAWQNQVLRRQANENQRVLEEVRGTMRAHPMTGHLPSAMNPSEKPPRIAGEQFQAAVRSPATGAQTQRAVIEPEQIIEQDMPASYPTLVDSRSPLKMESQELAPAGSALGNDALAAREFTLDFVRELYRMWCRGGPRPQTTGKIEIVSAAYDGNEPSRDPGGRPRHLLRDQPQIAEFVRFSPSGGGAGAVFPDPDAHYTPVIAHLFPRLSSADFAHREMLADLTPVPVRRRSESQWELQ